MMNVVRVHVPNVMGGYRHIIVDAIIKIAGYGYHQGYDYFEGASDPIVKFLVTNRELETVKNRFENNVDIDHVWEYIFEWYDADEETYYQEWHQLVDGTASVRRCNHGVGEGCFWSNWYELRPETEEEFLRNFEDSLRTTGKKLISWN